MLQLKLKKDLKKVLNDTIKVLFPDAHLVSEDRVSIRKGIVLVVDKKTKYIDIEMRYNAMPNDAEEWIDNFYQDLFDADVVEEISDNCIEVNQANLYIPEPENETKDQRIKRLEKIVDAQDAEINKLNEIVALTADIVGSEDYDFIVDSLQNFIQKQEGNRLATALSMFDLDDEE